MPEQVMWPRLVASKILSKKLATNNFVADFPRSPESFLDHLPTSDREPVAPVIILPENHITQNYNIFVSTWNAGGVIPTEDLSIDHLLDTHNTCCHIYVLGFQEVVPLKAANVLGLEKNKVSTKWNTLISKSLNKKSRRNDFMKSNSENSDEFRCLVSKRMVGLLLSVWVRSDLHPLFRNTNISCIGCGIMGYLGNKGSVAVRFQLHETSFCFVCSHLASGGGEGDERKRNMDATHIFSRTTFPTTKGPKRILDHHRVVLLGDLNYRISLPEKETRSLVNNKDWNTLLKFDQLRMELTDGKFGAWHEGTIDFAPTYKYLSNSDEYFGKDHETKRAPAWCDRIIWTGEELKQILYNTNESKLSDHRPVKAIFSTKVEVSRSDFQKCYVSDGYGQISTSLKFVSEDECSTTCCQLSLKIQDKIII